MTTVPDWARDYVGLPWRELGRDREGLDCWGLFRLVLAERFGLDVPAYDGVGFVAGADCAALARFIDAHTHAWRRLGAGELPRPGDGVLLRVRGQPIHVGVVVAPGWMLHIEQGIESVIERTDGPRWARRVIGIYRHAELDRPR